MTFDTKDFMSDIPRGDTQRYLNEQRQPQARFQKTERLLQNQSLAYDPAAPGDQILVGALGTQLIGIDDNRHILTAAGSRAGKSVGLINNLAFYPGSCLVMDPKGELANKTAERRAAMGQKVFVLDPFGYTHKKLATFKASYNPLSLLNLGSETLIEDANPIADAIVVQTQGNKDPHWDECAAEFLEGVMLHIATSPNYQDKRNLVTLRRLIQIAMIEAECDQDEEPLFILEQEMIDNGQRLQQFEETEDVGEAIEGAARSFYEKSERERDSVLSTIRRHTRFLNYRALRDVLSGHDFDLAALKKEKVTIYVCFPATRVEMSRRLLRMFINQFLDAMERETTKPDHPILLCLDEFPVLGYMRQLENAAGQVASFGVKLWVIIQDWSQGEALYGKRWETFVGNAGILQFFGINDVATAEYISKRLGKTPVEVARLGEVGKEQQEHGLSGRSHSVELHDLLTPEEITRLFARDDRYKRQLVLWAGYHPMILQRVEYYYQHSPVYNYFKGKVSQ